MVESAGALGPPPAPSRHRGELSAARTPPRGPAGKGGSHGFPKRRNEVRFREPLLACGGQATGKGKPASRARRGWGRGSSARWGPLSEVPEVSANYLAGASAGRERPILLWSICFFIASAPFLTLQSLLWLVSEMPRRVLTLRGGREEESRQPSIPLHTPQKKKKKKISAVFFTEELADSRRTFFTDLNDLGGKDCASERLVVAFLSIEEKILSGPLCHLGDIFEKWRLFRAFRFTNCCGSGLRIWNSDRAGKNSDHLGRFSNPR
ncbi:hypothetical protein NN561_013200 [Cricetulus griseus]